MIVLSAMLYGYFLGGLLVSHVIMTHAEWYDNPLRNVLVIMALLTVTYPYVLKHYLERNA